MCMSEYQYFEFGAVDRHLTGEEMCELRSFSTRANITSNSFVNEYSWGNFKGDEDAWMEKYFDGFLYYANWGTHILKLRLPSAFLDLGTIQLYCNGHNFSARLNDDNIILDFLSECEDGGDWEDEEGNLHLSQFLSLRSDLSRGDLRCLYLAWLSNLHNENYDEKELEPPIPPGLTELSPALLNFADFLRVDPDLIEAASKNSPCLEETNPTSIDLRAWLANLPTDEKENLLVDVLEGSLRGDQSAAMQLVHRFNKMWQSQTADKTSKPKKQRSVGELLKEAEFATQTRERLEAEQAAAEQAERQRLNILVRKKRLNEITGCESLLWNQIESLASEKKATSYDKAVELLIDLRELAARGNHNEFQVKFNALKQRHSAKSSFIGRLHKIETHV